MADERLYDDGQGRWVSSDPAGLGAVDLSNPQTLNRYVYVGNNPLSNVDPSGRYPVSIGNCTFDKIDSYVDGGYSGTSYNLLGCDSTNGNAGNGNNGQGLHGGRRSRNAKPTSPATNNGRNCSAGSASAGQYAAASAQVAAMTAQFFSGLGPTSQTLGPGSATSQVMGQSAGVQSVLNSYYMTGQTSGLYTFRVADIAMAGANPVAQFVGSFRWSISGGTLSLTNTTSFRSLFFDMGGQWQRFPLVTPYGTFTSPMGNTHQTYQIGVTCH